MKSTATERHGDLRNDMMVSKFTGFFFLIHPTLSAEEASNPEILTCVDETSPNKTLPSLAKEQGKRKPSKMENS